MHYLIPLVMAIGLSSLITWSMVSLLPYNSRLSEQFYETLAEGFDTFAYGVSEYRKTNTQYIWTEDCPPNATVGTNDPTCIWDRTDRIDGSLDIDAGDWNSLLVPDYMYLPKTPQGWSWFVGRNATGLYVCAQGDYNDVSARGLQMLTSEFTGTAFKVNASCASADPSMGVYDIGDYTGATLSATYWIAK